MPTVPLYDAPQVRPGQTPVPQISGSAPNYGAAVGQGLQQLGNTIEDVQLQAKHTAAQQLVQEKLNQFQQYRNGWDEQIQTLDGDKIKDPEYYGGQPGESLSAARARDTQDQYQKLVEGMSPMARRLFDQHAVPAMEHDRFRTSEHETLQIKKIQLDTQDASIAIAGDTADASVEKNGNFGWDKFDDAVTMARGAAAQKSALLGLTGDRADLMDRSAVASVVQRAVQRLLLRSNSTDAQKLIESYTDLLTPEVRNHYLERAKGINDDNTATNEAALAAAQATNIGTRNVQKGAIQAYLDRKDENGNFVLEPRIRKAAQEQAEHTVSNTLTDWARADDVTLRPVYQGLFSGGSSRQELLAQIKKLPISPQAATEATNHIHSWFAQRRSEARQDAEPILTPLQKAQQNLEYYNTITDPNFAKMTNAEIVGKVKTMGLQNTTQLMQDLYTVRNNPTKINEIHLDQQIAESAAKEFGIFSGDKPNDAEKLKIATMQAQAKAIIQASGQKAWPYEQQRELYRDLTRQIITDRGFLWDTKTPFFQVKQTTPIPDAFVKNLQAEAKARNLGMPSTSTIYQLWFDARGRGLVDTQGNPVKTTGAPSTPIITGAAK